MEKNIVTIDRMRGNEAARMYERTMRSLHKVGSHTYAIIPAELLHVPEYQRGEFSNQKKIMELMKNWNDDLCDALIVSNHPEENMFMVIDGFHRMTAGLLNGKRDFECNVLTLDAANRLYEEADIFRKQTKTREPVTPKQAHIANIICKEKRNIILEKAMRKFGILLHSGTGVRKGGKNVLTGFAWALIVADWEDPSIIEDTFEVLCDARWNITPGGLSNTAVRSVAWCLRLHPESTLDVILFLGEYLRKTSPVQFKADSYTAYPLRNSSERCILHMEDLVCDELGLDRKYKNDDSTIVRKPGKKVA